MGKYSKYKDSGVQWLGQIPGHWEVVSLKRITDFCPRSVFKFAPSQMVGYAPMETIRFDKMTPRCIEYSKLSTGLTYFETGDIVMAKVTPCFENGNLSIVPSMVHKSGFGSSELFVYRVHEHVINRFLLYGLRSNEFIAKGASTMTGTGGLKRVSSTFAKNAPIPLPPLSEQEAIVAFLDEKTSKIDKLVANKEKEIALLQEMKQRVIADAVTKGLNPNVQFKETGISWLPQVPKHWERIKMKYLFTERSEKKHPNEPMLSATQSDGVILQSKYQNRVVVVNTGFEGLKLVKVGDFVIHLRSFQGGIEYAHDQGIISSAYTILYPKEYKQSPYYRYLFKSKPFIDLLKTCVTGIREGQNINYTKLKQYLLPVPPLPEQEAIVAHIEDRVSKIDALTQKLQKEIDCAKEYKQRLISDAVTGQIKVC